MAEKAPALLPYAEMEQRADVLRAALGNVAGSDAGDWAEFHIRNAPDAAAIELAKRLARFETQIDDTWRAALIDAGGALVALERIMTAGEA